MRRTRGAMLGLLAAWPLTGWCAAMDLDAFARDPLGHLGGLQLRHRGPDAAAPPGVHLGADLVEQCARRLDLGGHVRDLEADRLVAGDRPAELDPLPGVGDGVLQRAAGQPDCSCGGMDAGDFKVPHHDFEALALGADHHAGCDARAVKGQLPCLPAVIADLADRSTGHPVGQ